MPIYEYQCQSCERRSEVLQRIADPPLETCEECGGELRKLVSAPAFQFKGSGWYVTDYARKDGKSDSKDKSDSGSGDKDKGSGSSSSDSSSSSKDSSSSGSKKSESKKSSD